MRRELGRELKERRRAAGLSQSELARLTGRSRSLVSTLESATGSAAGLGFWQRCDEVLSTGGRFARRWLQIQRESEAERARVADSCPQDQNHGGRALHNADGRCKNDGGLPHPLRRKMPSTALIARA